MFIMEEEVIEIEDYEVKEKSLVPVEDGENDDYSNGSSNDNSRTYTNYDNSGYTSASWTVVDGNGLIIVAMVVILLIAIILLTFH